MSLILIPMCLRNISVDIIDFATISNHQFSSSKKKKKKKNKKKKD